MYIDLLVNVSNNRRISVLLLSNSLLVPMEVLQPTPLDQIEYLTLPFSFWGIGKVKSQKNSRSVKVSISSSASGFASSNSSGVSRGSGLSSGCASSNKTSVLAI